MTGIVICHKSLAFDLIETANAILGHKEELYAFSNEKITTEEAVTKINSLIQDVGNPENVIFMVDLQGGNCWTIAKILSRSRPGYFVLSGVNLPMIFSFLTKKNQLSVLDLVHTIEKDAHRGISLEP
jgi:mannose/fructose-specific phosphotransferase system component IIA